MAVSSGTELIAALARYDSPQLLGSAEGPRIEFKRPAAYRLENDGGKWELAKDVAAMANVEGGLIVIGVATTKDPYVPGDVAIAIEPCKTPYNLTQIKDVLASWLFPPQLVGLTAFPVAADSPEHLLVITVDPVQERDRYVMVRKEAMDNGKYRNAVAVPLRVGDDTRWLSADELYRLLNDGHRVRQAGPLARAVSPPTPSGEEVNSRADRALDRLELEQGWNDEPVLMWQSYVDPAADPLPGLFSTDGIGAFLDGPNALRPMGFHFHNPYVAVQTTATGLLLGSRDGLAVEVGLDGTVTAGVVASRSLLARSQEWSTGLPISSIVLTELTYEYFRLADEHVAPRAEGVWHHRLVARRMKERGVTLSPGRPGGIAPGRRAIEDEWDKRWPARGDAALDAAAALERVYSLFTLDAHEANLWIAGGRVDIHKFIEDMRTSASPAPG